MTAAHSSITATPATTRTYEVTGMTCGSCEARVVAALESLPQVAAAAVSKDTGTAELQLAVPVGLGYLQSALGERYRISAPERERAAAPTPRTTPAMDPADREDRVERSWWATYRPLLTIVGLIALVTVLAQAPFTGGLDGATWMRHFMAGFFVVFAGFKLLDIRGFAESYAMYDVIAGRWRDWGYVYPFVELGLGLAYLTDVAPSWTNVATVLILGVSAVGVIRSVLDRRAIKCACLGTGFDLPMSTVTIVEDVGMVGMAVWMLVG